MAMYVQTAEWSAGAVGSSRRQVNPGSKVGRSRAALATGGASTGSAGNGGSSMSASTALAKKEKKWDKLVERILAAERRTSVSRRRTGSGRRAMESSRVSPMLFRWFLCVSIQERTSFLHQETISSFCTLSLR